jgi:hypothetical protein
MARGFPERDGLNWRPLDFPHGMDVTFLGE